MTFAASLIKAHARAMRANLSPATRSARTVAALKAARQDIENTAHFNGCPECKAWLAVRAA